MINTTDVKVKEIVLGFHEAFLQKARRSNRLIDHIVKENHLLTIISELPDMGPGRYAELMNDRYSYRMTYEEVIRIFHNRQIGNPLERKLMLKWAREVADCFVGALQGDKAMYEKFQSCRKEAVLPNGKRHEMQERLVVMAIYQRYPELDVFNDRPKLYGFGTSLARYYFYDMADIVNEAYGFRPFRRRRYAGNKLTYEQAMQRIEKLEETVERTNTMLRDLQDEFEEELAASKVKELTDFFAKLNSEKYGCILDELLVVRRGVDTLRRNNFEVPIEINGVLILVKKLIQFVRDSQIEPMMRIDSVQEVTAKDVEFCDYEGKPFVSQEEKKMIRVISPGWVYKEKALQIARPKVKEVEVWEWQ